MLAAQLGPACLGAGAHRPRRRGTAALRVQAAFGEDVRKFFDGLAFENWAPRSSRTWRLPPTQRRAVQADESKAAADEAFIASLNDRIVAASRDEADKPGPSSGGTSTPSFDDAGDDELASALSARIADLGEGLEVGSAPAARPVIALSGTELRESIQRKYGRTYDLSIVRRQLAGRTIVAMNVMWTHLEQQSFPMSEPEYMEKLNNIAFYLGAWGQTEVVRAFFDAPAKSRNGLPGRRPVVGNAISLRLELPAAVIEEWFGK